VTYQSSDETVVSVNSDGVLTYVGEGTATITVSVPQLAALIETFSDAPITQQVTVNARKSSYSVTLHAGTGGTISKSGVTSVGGGDYTLTFIPGTAVTLPAAADSTPIDAQYYLAGWCENENLTGTAITSIPANSIGDKEYWAKWDSYETKYETAADTWVYGTITQALNSSTGAMDGGRIVLLKDVTTTTQRVYKSVILLTDGTARTLNMGTAFLEVSSATATLTIADEKLTITGSYSYGTIWPKYSGATVLLQAGTVKNTGTGSGIYSNTSGTVIQMTGGVVSADSGHAIRNLYAGTVTVDGGEIRSNSKYGISNGSGTVTVEDGVISSSTNYGIYNDSGTITINGGEISSNSSYGIYNGSGTVTINGGEISSNSSSGINNSSSGVINVDGGTVSSTSGAAIFNNTSGTVNVTAGTVDSESSYGIFNNGSGTITVEDGTISSTSGGGIHNNVSSGKVTIEGGTISSAATNLYAISNAGTLTLKGGTVKNTVGSGLYMSSGTLTISGGTVSGKDKGINYSGGSGTISGGDVSGDTYAIYSSNKTINLSGAPTLSGGTADIYLYGASALLSFPMALSGSETYTVATNSFSMGKVLSAAYETADYSARFISTDATYHIGYNSAKKLFLQRVVTITPTTGLSKIYGTNDPTLTYTQSPAASATGALTGAIGRAPGSSVGTYAYTLGTLGASSENYYLALSASAPTFAITHKEVAIPTIADKTYNGSAQGHGLSDGADYVVSVESGDTASATNVGTYKVTASLLDASNMQWVGGTSTAKSIEWKIVPKAITVLPTAAARKVGETNPSFTIELADGSDLTAADILAYGASALAYAAGTATFACLDDEDSPVDADSPTGTYDITITALEGGSSNYTVSYTGVASTGTLTVIQDALGSGDYTITPAGYTEGDWTDSIITVSPAGSYQTIRSVAADGTKGSWVTSLTVQDASASLKFECKTTTGSGAGAISAPKTLSLQSDTKAPISTTPVETVNTVTGVTTVTLTLSDDATPGLLSGIDVSSVTLTQGGADCTTLISDSLTAGLSDNQLNLTFIRGNTADYTLTYSDNAGNVSTTIISMTANDYNVTFAPGSNGEGGTPSGTDPTSMSVWQYRKITLPANPYTLDAWYFTGWKTTVDGEEEIYQPGAIFTMPDGAVTFTAVWELCEAKYETATNVWSYGTFAQALTNVMAGGRIGLQKDVTATDDITINKSITLLTDGVVSSAALTMGAYNLQVLDGTLTINDADLTITGSDSTYGTVIIRSGSASTAKIVLQAGKVTNTGNSTGAKAAIYTDIAGSTISIAGGTVQSTNGSGINLSNGSLSVTGGNVQSTNGSGISISNGTLSVSGGTISSAVGDGIFIEGTGSVSVSDGTIRSTAAYAVKVTGGSLTMNGGAVTATADVGIYVTGGTVTVNDGTIDSDTDAGIYVTGGTVTVNDGTIESDTDAGIYVTDGTVNVTGGNIDSDSDAGIYITDGDLSVTGGEIIGDTYAIHVNEANNSGNTLALSGAPKLTGAAGDIYFTNAYRALEITAALTGEEIYSITAAAYDAGAPLSTTYATNYASKFKALNAYWHIGYSSDDESTNYQKLIWQKVVTITPDSAQSKTYTATDPTYTYKASALGAEITPASAGITGALERAAGENVTTYAYTLGTLAATEGYYLVMSASAPTFSITSKEITIPTIADKTYNGTSQGYGASDETAYTFSAQGTDSTDATNAGSYTITAMLTNTVNYKWADDSITAKSVAWKILPKAITVLPAAATRKVGEVNPDFTIKLADGSTLTEADHLAYGADALAYAAGTPTFSCVDDENRAVDADSAAGTYDITITSLTGGSSNYAATYTGAASTGTLTITQDVLDTGDYTIAPSGYTVGNWTNSTITLYPAGSYQTIRSVAADGSKGNWETLLTVQDASASLKFECKTTTGSSAGAISQPTTLSLKSDTKAPVSTAPAERVNKDTGVMTVALTLSDDATPGLLSGLDVSGISLKQGAADCTGLINDSINTGLTDGKLNLTFIRQNTLDYTLTYSDLAGNQSTVTISMEHDDYTLSFAPGENTEGDIPSGTTPSNLSLWEYSLVTLPASPYTLPDYLFCGWEYKGKLYAPGDTFSMPDGDVTLTAVWIPEEVWSDVTVYIIYQNGKQVSHAQVNLYLEGELIQQTQSNGSGKVHFKKLVNQVYEVEVIITDEPVNQIQTFKVIVQDKKVISGDNGREITELTVTQPKAVADVSKKIRNILPQWEDEDVLAAKQACWEGSDETAKTALENEVRTVSREVLDLAREYDALTLVQTNQFFDDDLDKWSLLLAVTGKITLTLAIETQMAGIDNPDALIGLLITAEDLEQQANSNEDIQIVFQIKDIPPNVDDETVRKSLAQLSLRGGANQREYKFFEVTIRKIIGENETNITQTPKDVELMFWIPENMQNGTDYLILRDHQGVITALPTRRIGNILYAWSSHFSNFAIAYTPTPDNGGGSGSGTDTEVDLLLPPPIDVTSPKTTQQLPVTANAWIAVPATFTGIGKRKLRAPVPRRKML
jgi:hypothetical protein